MFTYIFWSFNDFLVPPADFLNPVLDFFVPLEKWEISDRFLDFSIYLAEFLVFDFAFDKLLKLIYMWASFGVFDFFSDLSEWIGSRSLSMLIDTFLLDY